MYIVKNDVMLHYYVVRHNMGHEVQDPERSDISDHHDHEGL